MAIQKKVPQFFVSPDDGCERSGAAEVDAGELQVSGDLTRPKPPPQNGGWFHMGVSENYGTPKSSILIGFSLINHPFWGYHYFWKHPYGDLPNRRIP